MKKPNLAISVQLSCFIHATEEEERVVTALRNVLPEELRNYEQAYLKKSVNYGYYGNPIILLQVEFTGSEADKVVYHIFMHLPKEDLEEIFRDFENRFAKGRLYLRLDKQEAYYGGLRISVSDDVIKCVIKFKPHLRKQEDIERALREQGIKI